MFGSGIVSSRSNAFCWSGAKCILRPVSALWRTLPAIRETALLGTRRDRPEGEREREEKRKGREK